MDRTLADPLEGISYGRNKAKVFRRADGALIIHSFAHGGGLYHLKHDYRLLLGQIEAMSDETDIRDFVDAATLAHLESGELDVLVAQVKVRTRINKGVVRECIKVRQTERANFAGCHVENEEPGDARARFPLPPRGGELTPVLAQVDAVLREVDLPVPPFRTIDGHMARVVKRPITGLYTLVSDASEGGDPMPAPAQLSIVRAEDAEVTMMIEEHVRFVDHRQQKTRLQLPFIRAYAVWDRSSLPRVSGISELPLVLPDHTLRAGCGLDRELGLIMAIPQPLLDVLNETEEVSLEQAREDYRWLCENWFVDVDTDNEGKAIIIALALTLIERHLLPERPAFFVTAAQRGSGKTTILNMVSAAVTGQLAAAASWSFDDEERRKGLFSYMREAAPMVVYDNIPRGAKVSCPTIERVLTSPELADRVLGESRTETVPAATIFAFTGNNIGPKGDLASRSLVASVSADRPDPENREFRHDDPIGWTKAHRVEILRRLFNILRCNREQPEIAKTRFKPWYRLVGHPVELVADVDFEGIFRANDAMDEELQGAIEFFTMMRRFLARDSKASREFTASEVTKLLNENRVGYGGGFPSTDPEMPDPDDLKSALEEASGRPFTGGDVNSRRVGIKLKSIAGRPVEVDGILFHLVVVENHEGNRYRIEPLD